MLSSPCALLRKSFLRCSPRRRRTSPSAFSTRWKTAAFTQESAAYAPKLAEWCVKVLKLSVLFALAVNVLQAFCAPMLLSTSISIRLPIFELCFVLAALLGARLIASNVALAADNDLFI